MRACFAACAARTFAPAARVTQGSADRWANEPLEERHPDLTVHTPRPFNAEPSNVALQSMITPKGQHYRRTHAPVPVVDGDKYRVSIGIEARLLQSCHKAVNTRGSVLSMETIAGS